MKQLEINCPKGYEIDQDRSDLSRGIIHFKKAIVLKRYEDISEDLFDSGTFYHLTSSGIDRIGIRESKNARARHGDWDNSTSNKQLKSILALNKLCNVAKYLNADWLPDFNNDVQQKHCIYIDIDEIKVGSHQVFNEGSVWFKSNKLAEQAIRILGEDMIRRALILNY